MDPSFVALRILRNTKFVPDRANLKMITLKVVDKLLLSNVPYFYTIILSHRNYVLLIRSDAYTADWVSICIRQLIDHILGLCIPYLHSAVIMSRHNVGLRSTYVHVQAFRLRVNGSWNLTFGQIPKLNEEIMWCCDCLFLMKTEFGRSNQIFMGNKWLLSFNLSLIPANSVSLISSAWHQVIIVNWKAIAQIDTRTVKI